MRILHVTCSLSRTGGGVASAVTALATHTQSRPGSHVTLLGLRDAHTDKDAAEVAGVAAQAFASQGPVKLGWSRGLRRAVKRSAMHADVIHAHGLWRYPGWVAASQAARAGCPRVVSIHGMLAPAALSISSRFKRIAWKLVERSTLETAHCLHATSSAEVRDIRRRGLSNPIARVPLGIDPTQYRTEPGDSDLLDRHPAMKDRRLMVSLARLHPIKGFPSLIGAWAQVRRQHPDWLLVIAGPDEQDHLRDLEALVEELGMSDHVCFPGPLYADDKANLLAAAELFVLPSISENFGLTVCEALVSACPVIATHGTPWQILPEKRCGWWIPNDEPHLCDTLKESLSLSPQTLRAMGDRGRQLVYERFTWASVTDQMMMVYQWLRGEAPEPDCIDRPGSWTAAA